MAGTTNADRDTTGLPLSDLRVVELGNIVAGPFASSILADLGADVVKVERPGSGDVIRSSGEEGDAIFTALNRNKRSVALNLKSDEGLQSFYSLIEKADVFIENLGKGTPERLGIGYDQLKERNSRLIYLSIKGFQEGPYGSRAGMDVVAEAMSGLMSVTGEPGRPPVRVGTSIADMGAAMYGVMGVFIALRDRDRTGLGQRVDGTLFEAAAHWISYWITFADLYGQNPEPLGASHPSWGLYDVFETKDGWLFVGVTTDRHWPAFCEATGLTDLQEDERFATATDRREHQDALINAVQEQFQRRSRGELIKALTEVNVPVAPVNKPSDLIDDPGLDAADLLARFQRTADEKPTQTVLAPVKGERFGPAQYRRPPEVGEHTEEVLSEVDTPADLVAESDD